MEEGATLVNAVVGAVVSVLGSMFVPVAPFVGGAVAGYFQGGMRTDGVRVGLIAGLIAIVPAILLGTLVFGIFGTFLLGMGPGVDGVGVGVVSGGFLLVIALTFGAIVVGLSAAGGWVGNYIKHEADIDL